MNADQQAHPADPSQEGTRNPDKEQEIPTDIAEKPGTDQVAPEHADELVDEWGEESFPGSDPPAHY